MTQEEKAKSYDEALKKMKAWVRGEHPECFTEAQKAAEFIFPELKESEDERIRKAIMEFFELQDDNTTYSFIPKKDILTWLETQGEKKSKKVSIWKHWKDGIAGNAEGKQIYLTKIGNTYNLSSCLSFECDYIELSDLDNLMSKGQCEPNPYSGVSFKYNGHTFGMCARDGGAEVLMDGNLKAFISSEKSFVYPHPTLTPKSALEAAKEEKIDNDQNWVIPNSNPEPKFYEGEWVVYNHDICQIVKREEGCNKLVTVFGIEKELVNERNLSTAHLWTIQDAKDGDVLACNGEILLFKSYSVQGRISLYCWYNGQTNNFHNKEVVDVLLTTRNKVCPATKEQRDLLFQKMEEIGYEWDADKKELKKIERNPVEIDDTNAKRMFIKALEMVEEQNNKGYKLTDCDKNSWWEDFKTYTSCTCEQKSTNNPEPKFYEEDWIVIDDNPCQIINIDNRGNYIVQYCNDEETHVLSKNFCESHFHLWTIQDAKDGDVLVGKIDGDDYILIFKQIKDGWIETYGHYYGAVDRVCVPSQLFCRDYKGTFYPTTKELRDFLFSKMKEAGYEWDADKKELKIVDWSKHIKYNPNATSITEEKPAWTEEDTKKLYDILSILGGGENCFYNSPILIDWLKSLKERIGG